MRSVAAQDCCTSRFHTLYVRVSVKVRARVEVRVEVRVRVRLGLGCVHQLHRTAVPLAPTRGRLGLGLDSGPGPG